MAKSAEDAALGALLGAACGDAIGAYLEFTSAPSEKDIDTALAMPGGGTWQVAPGQITDDTELMLCLAQGLATQTDFDLEPIATQYAMWIRSPPFDIGGTTASSLGTGTHVADKREPKKFAEAMRESALRNCVQSKANGSLMRATPLGVWGHKLPADRLAAIARADSSLSHPNPVCGDVVACYSISIAHLINHRGDNKGAMEAAEAWAATSADDEVKAWLADARDGRLPPKRPLEGFVKIAFTHAFHHLHKGTSYVEAIRDSLRGGGDTDTNAAIVGGLIGALHGAEAIPEPMRQAVLNSDHSKGYHVRPNFLHSRLIPVMATMLLSAAANARVSSLFK